MASILKVDTIQDQDGNNIISEAANTITIGASGDTITIPSGATLANSGIVTGFQSTGIDDNATSTAITIDSSENVGIGSVPKAFLQPNYKAIDMSSGRTVLMASTGTPQTNLLTNSYYKSGGYAYSNTGYGATNYLGQDSEHKWYTAPSGTADAIISFTERMRIASNGDISFYEDTGTTPKFFWDASTERLGIGTSSPSEILHIEGNSPYLVISNTGENVGGIKMYDSGGASTQYFNLTYDSGASNEVSFDTGASGEYTFNVNTAEKMRIDSSGNVLIGTTDAGYPVFGDNLTLESSTHSGITIRSGTSSQGNLYFSDATGTGTGTYAGAINYLHSVDAMVFLANSGESMRIDSSGRIGIGTNSPSAKLHVDVSNSGVTPHANADDLFVEGNTHSGITIGSSTSTGGNIYFGDSADNDIGRINYDHSADRMNFTTNTQAGFFMQTMTNVTITTSYANMLTIPFGGYLIEIGSSANNASREIWLVLRNGAAYSAATTRLLQRTGNDGPRTYNIRVPADGILEAKLDSGSTITDAKITLFKFGM